MSIRMPTAMAIHLMATIDPTATIGLMHIMGRALRLLRRSLRLLWPSRHKLLIGLLTANQRIPILGSGTVFSPARVWAPNQFRRSAGDERRSSNTVRRRGAQQVIVAFDFAALVPFPTMAVL